MFERFEILASLAYLETIETAALEAVLTKHPPHDWVRMPVGRSSRHDDVLERLIKEIQDESLTKALLDAGFASGSKKHLDLSIINLSRIAGRLS